MTGNPRRAGRGAAVAICTVLAAANLAAWAAAWALFGDRPTLVSSAMLAYIFGLRHAFDADHIAAIDNVTRRLMQRGRRPIGVGLFFALGHSSVVIALSLLIALSAGRIYGRFAALGSLGAVIGTAVSALFLFLIAAANLVVLGEVWGLFRSIRAGRSLDDIALRQALDRRGLLARLLRPAFRLVGASWHMYPVGMLFGLGFDTATEIGLLGISATVATTGASLWSILVFPALFTAGMTLADTIDGIVMAAAYGWAFVTPVRKLWYNLTITLLSVLIAVFVGLIEALGLIGGRLGLAGPFWRGLGVLGRDPAILGCAILAVFVAGWVVSHLIFRLKPFDDPA